jgi:hypothetical protein
VNASAQRLRGVALDWRPWIAASAALGVATIALVAAASRIRIPRLRCELPYPPAELAKWISTTGRIAELVRIAEWLAIAGFGVAFLGAVVPRRAAPAALFLLLYLLVVLAAVGYGQSIPHGRCGD